ncbi:MAG: VCBS repeat-containing protein, partial [Planctomycetes bacterium]|nr:VCBS repeat-containing protein [Planctomycetota bacterium]
MSRFPLNHPLKSLAAVSVVAIAAAFWWNSREIAVETVKPVDDAVQDDKTLALQLRKRIWDIEHFAFLMETEVFPIWKAALAKGKPARLIEYLATDFVGRVIDEPLNSVLTDGPLAVQSTQRPRMGGRTVDADGFLQALFAFRRLLDPGSDSCRLKIGLVRFGPKKPSDLHGPWQCVWRIRMAGTRKNAPVEVVLDLSLTVDTLDEKIGSRKRWIRSAAIDRVVVSRSTKFLLQETTKTSGIPVERLHDNWRHAAKEFRTKTGGVYLSDFDRDGVLDVLVEDIDAGTRLYRGLGKGRFEDVTEKSGLPVHTPESTPPWTGCCWADLDGDGDEDLILQDKLFENQGDGTFRDVTKKSNLILTPTAGYAVADYDRDGKVDLYVCHSGKYLVGQQLNEKTPWIDGGLGINNVLWRNLGNWQFEDVTRETNAGGDGSACFAAVWFDANNDRWPDLLAVNEFGRNSLLIN